MYSYFAIQKLRTYQPEIMIQNGFVAQRFEMQSAPN